MNKYQKIVIRQKKGSKGAMSGANTEVFIDGKELTGCTRLDFQVAALGLARVTLELIGRFEISGQIDKIQKKVKEIK